jgi:hypothetical protein
MANSFFMEDKIIIQEVAFRIKRILWVFNGRVEGDIRLGGPSGDCSTNEALAAIFRGDDSVCCWVVCNSGHHRSMDDFKDH